VFWGKTKPRRRPRLFVVWRESDSWQLGETSWADIGFTQIRGACGGLDNGVTVTDKVTKDRPALA
jgi:hypothetical protein